MRTKPTKKMAKRFTAIEKWQDEWFSTLKPIDKLVFIYMTETCDNAGFYEINPRINSFVIGISHEEYMKSVKSLEKSFEWGRDGKKVYIKNFLKYQNNFPLNESNNYHKQIIKIIKSNIINFEHITYFSPFLAPSNSKQTVQSPLVLVLGLVLGKEEEKKLFEIFKSCSLLPDWQIQEEIPKYFKWAKEKNISNHGAAINKWVANVTPKTENPKQPRIKLK